MSGHNLGYIRLSYNDLKHILDIPEDVQIIGVECGAFVHETSAVHITLEHKNFPEVLDGSKIPKLEWRDVESCRSSQETTSSIQ